MCAKVYFNVKLPTNLGRKLYDGFGRPPDGMDIVPTPEQGIQLDNE